MTAGQVSWLEFRVGVDPDGPLDITCPLCPVPLWIPAVHEISAGELREIACAHLDQEHTVVGVGDDGGPEAVA